LFPEDYAELQEILKRLGLHEEAAKYALLAKKDLNSAVFE